MHPEDKKNLDLLQRLCEEEKNRGNFVPNAKKNENKLRELGDELTEQNKLLKEDLNRIQNQRNCTSTKQTIILIMVVSLMIILIIIII